MKDRLSILLLILVVMSIGAAPVPDDMAKLDPVLQRLSAGDPTKDVHLLVRLRNGAATPAIAGITMTRTGDIISVRGSAASLAALAAHPDVLQAECAKPVRLLNDLTNGSTLGVRGTISIAAEVDNFTLNGTAGESVRIIAMSEDGAVDTFLTVTDGGAVTDMDSGPGTDAMVTITWATTGVKSIDVEDQASTGTGDYVLFVVSDQARAVTDLSGAAFFAGTSAAVTGFTGNGVVIGFVDSGIDFTHADFLDAAGNTRLLGIWDQTLTPQAGETSPSAFGYGVEYTRPQIDDDLDGITPGFVRQQDTVGHGTHVAGTAAGDDPAFPGAAPAAQLVMVKFNDTTTGVIDAINFIANATTLPVVINLSIGSHDGPHDGTSLFDVAIDSLSDRGVVIVAASGNEANDALHAQSLIGIGGSDDWEFTPGALDIRLSGIVEGHVIDIWADGNDRYDVTVTDGATVVTATDGTTNSVITGFFDGATIDNRVDTPSNGDVHIRIEIFNLDADPWTITLSRVQSNGTGVVDGWLTNTLAFTDPGDLTMNADGSWPGTVGEPGTAMASITVGAFRTKFAWDDATPGTTRQAGGIGVGVPGNIADFSSRGPTRDNRTKPDICAPGAYVGSARSVDSSPAAADDDVDTVHTYLQGTSMSTPAVAGVIAQLFEKNSIHNEAEIKQFLAQTAVQDAFVTTGNAWGSGKIDAVALLAGVVLRRDVVAKGICSASSAKGSWAPFLLFFLLCLVRLRRFA